MTIAVRSPFLEFGCILPPTEGELYQLVLQSKISLDILACLQQANINYIPLSRGVRRILIFESDAVMDYNELLL